MLSVLLEIRWHLIFNPKLAIDSIPFVLEGLGYTLLISTVSFLIAVFGGLLIALLRLSKIALARGFARFYVSFFRGVPLIVTLFLLYLGLPIIGIVMPAITASLIGMGLTGMAYASEIIRASIEAIDIGQWEAARALGLTYSQVLRYIVLPQAAKISLPPLTNVMVDMVKTSSITAMITVPEIFNKAKVIGGAEHDFMTMYILVAIIYWLICLVFAKIQDVLEKKLSY